MTKLNVDFIHKYTIKKLLWITAHELAEKSLFWDMSHSHIILTFKNKNFVKLNLINSNFKLTENDFPYLIILQYINNIYHKKVKNNFIKIIHI